MGLREEAVARAAKQQYILKGPPPDNWCTRMPAYAGTVLCPDRRYWPKVKKDKDKPGD